MRFGMKCRNVMKCRNGMKRHNGMKCHNGMKRHNGTRSHNGMKYQIELFSNQKYLAQLKKSISISEK